ncbi:hypothetical protein L9F63_014409, partial [Diploptera punctata]
MHIDICVFFLLLLWGLPMSSVDGTVTITSPTEVKEKTKICGSIDIRNHVREFQQLRGCNVVEGFVQIVLVENANESEFQNLSFPELREITNYLILFRVRKLKKLGPLFPNLTVIRGIELFLDYSLVIYDMHDLEELGLWSLTAVQRGSVRIENNRMLCFYNTVDWKNITVRGDYYVGHNKDHRSCPSKSLCDVENCSKNMCWGTQVQNCRKPPKQGECHDLCLGGCTGPRADQCFVCKEVLNDGKCVLECPLDSGMQAFTAGNRGNVSPSTAEGIFSGERFKLLFPCRRLDCEGET